MPLSFTRHKTLLYRPYNIIRLPVQHRKSPLFVKAIYLFFSFFHDTRVQKPFRERQDFELNRNIQLCKIISNAIIASHLEILLARWIWKQRLEYLTIAEQIRQRNHLGIHLKRSIRMILEVFTFRPIFKCCYLCAVSHVDCRAINGITTLNIETKCV